MKKIDMELSLNFVPEGISKKLYDELYSLLYSNSTRQLTHQLGWETSIKLITQSTIVKDY